MLPVIKVWEMDYSFIIKNYLNPIMWNKVWTLFAYKDFVITIQMDRIYTANKKISFCIKLKDNSNENTYSNSRTEEIDYIVNTNIDFLIKRINGTIFRLINSYERLSVITKLPSYAIVDEFRKQEKERLRQFANDFLDENNVTNEDIRDVYVDNYVSNNSEADDYAFRFRNANEYHHLTDLYLVFAKSIKDDENYQKVLDCLQDDEREKIINEISEMQTLIETDLYTDEKKCELESIWEE